MAKNDKNENNDLASQLMNDINKDLQEEVAVLVDDGSPSDVKVFIPTGSTLLDYVISNQVDGGIPVGKLTEIAGLEGCVHPDTLVEVIIED